ncbi:MAG: PSD1 and planctomycete cytochrome C domain-containing protein [Pirellulales bacterium]
MAWALFVILSATPPSSAQTSAPSYEREVAPLLKNRCVKCHGPATREGQLFLATPAGLMQGGKSGPAVVPHDVAASLLWTKVSSDDMPPDDPLPDAEKQLLRRWILAGAPGLRPLQANSRVEADHWSFRPLQRPTLPPVAQRQHLQSPIDYFVQAALEQAGLAISPTAPRSTLARRARYALTGLPPRIDELDLVGDAASGNSADDAYEQLVDRWLSSPQFGPRWGKVWLDAAGYADSNGYFGADTDRPLAYRYRDYVVRSLNADKQLDRFIVEQLAGDELAQFTPGKAATDQQIEWLEATHFLRNGQDGSGESDGNPDEVRADRYYALESSQQLVSGTLLGLTIQCAKCHDHKFEPITQRDFYRLQAILYPAFPIEQWVKPNDRAIFAPRVGETEAWQARLDQLAAQLAEQQRELEQWVRAKRPQGDTLFVDSFDAATDASTGEPWTRRWSDTAPGDDAPGGDRPVEVDGQSAPAARVHDGTLRIIESGGAGNRWLSTTRRFDWTPDNVGEAIQVTFDLVDNRHERQGTPAERVGYYLALHDYNDNSPVAGGNILIDGHPSAATAVVVDYPGADNRGVGQIGGTGYQPGKNFGVRITKLADGKFSLEHLVDGLPEEKSITLTAADLPDGGFGFEYCCGRSFVVDNVRVERFGGGNAGAESRKRLDQFVMELKQQRAGYDRLRKERDSLASAKPGKIAWLADVSNSPPDVHLLTRGNYATRGEKVEPGPPSVLSDLDNPYQVGPSGAHPQSTGRRRALAEWLTRPGSRPSALMARVQANRIWQHYFGVGIVATSENLGLGGAPPTHPELLEWLAAELVDSQWNTKELHRQILLSATFRQSSAVTPRALELDPTNRLLSRFPLLRLDAESLRDGMLAASGELDTRLGGPYVPTSRDSEGEVVADEESAGARRRSLYLYQRRTQIVSFLNVFDSPSIVFLSTQRNRSTTPLQSLTLWNSPFVLRRAAALATRVQQEASTDAERLNLLWQVAYGRPMTTEEQAAAKFLDDQSRSHAPASEARSKAWIDLAQAVLMSNAFLYLE